MNDPYMNPDELARTAADWGSDIVNLGSVGHINIAAGFGRWSEGYALFARLKAASEIKASRSRKRGSPVLHGALLQGDAGAL
jgi:hypothetical protein